MPTHHFPGTHTRALAVAVASLFTAACLVVAGCAHRTQQNGQTQHTGLAGHLLIIGGGLDDDNRPVYERLIHLARRGSGGQPARIIIAAAASGDQDDAISGKVESIRAYCPDCIIESIRRETPTAETVALIDSAQAMFFTGGDQKRITTRYLTPEDGETPESSAIRRLLARGGVIAGTSAGDAMMSDPMFFTGRSAEALGIRSTRTGTGPDDDPDEKRPLPPLGPRIGKGMGLIPWVITDSHFFERDRFGRLVAALETSGKRLGLGIGEDACVEVDLATGMLTGVSVADSLLVDAGGLTRDGLTRRNVRAMVVKQGGSISLPGLLASHVPIAPTAPAQSQLTTIAEPGQNRQLASWRFFVRAGTTPGATQFLELDGYTQSAWPDGTSGWSIVTIEPTTTPSATAK